MLGVWRTLSACCLLFLAGCVTTPSTPKDLSAVIVQNYGGDANAYVYNNLPYYDIISAERVDLLAVLVKHGIDFDAFATHESYGVPIFFALYFSKERSLAYMLENGATIAAAEQQCLIRECEPDTPLLLAMERDNPRIVQLMIENGARLYHTRLARQSKEANFRAAIEAAINSNSKGTLRGFELAGYAPLVASVRSDIGGGQSQVAHAGNTNGTSSQTQGNDGSDVLGALAGVAIGNMVGGDLGKGIMARAVIEAMTESANSTSNQPATSTPAAPSAKPSTNTSLAQLDIPSNLPPDIQRDMLVVQISDLVDRDNPQATLPLFQRLNDLPVPIDEHTDYFWGKSLIEAGRKPEGLKRLYRYVKRLDKDSAYYRPTLRLIAGAQS